MANANPFTNQYTPNIKTFFALNNKPQATNSIVPSDSRPLSGMENYASGASFKARPIKHWRKQLNPNSELGSSGRGRANLGMPMDTPGGSVYLHGQSNLVNNACIECSDTTNSLSAGIKEDIVRTSIQIVPTVASDTTLYPSGSTDAQYHCVACNPENNVIKYSATTVLSKNYYSDTKAYLKSRCLLYSQKMSGTPVPGIIYSTPCPSGCGVIPIPPSDSWMGSQVRATQNCLKPTCTNADGGVAGLTIYKPSNTQYATQGAVSSSARIDRLKYNTINVNGNSFRAAWGSQGANAGKYQGTSTAPYFLKSKYQVPTVFHARQDHQICCKPNPNNAKPLVVAF